MSSPSAPVPPSTDYILSGSIAAPGLVSQVNTGDTAYVGGLLQIAADGAISEAAGGAQTFTAQGDFTPVLFAAQGTSLGVGSYVFSVAEGGTQVTLNAALGMVQQIGSAANYDSTTGVWTCPLTGYYRVGAYTGDTNNESSDVALWSTQIWKTPAGGSASVTIEWSGPVNSTGIAPGFSIGGSHILHLNVGDKLYLSVYTDSTGTESAIIGYTSMWSVELVGTGLSPLS
jgi:hypothetical protein